MNALKMEDDKLPCRHLRLYDFRKRVSVGNATENIQNVYMDRAAVSSDGRKVFFADFARSILSETINQFPGVFPMSENTQFAEETKPRIWAEEIAKSLKIDISPAFRHLKRPGFKKNGRIWQIEKVPFTSTTAQDGILQT